MGNEYYYSQHEYIESPFICCFYINKKKLCCNRDPFLNTKNMSCTKTRICHTLKEEIR